MATELREDGGHELRQDGGLELRQIADVITGALLHRMEVDILLPTMTVDIQTP